MAPKRKHVASPTAPTPEAGPSAKKSRAGLNAQSTNSTADDDNDNNHSYKVEAEWELVGTDKKYTRFIGSKSLNAVVPIVADRLGASMVGLQIMHVRQGGMESPVWDDYDFKAIRNRAEATGSKKETLRVYSAAIGQHPTPPSSLAGSAPPSVERTTARDTLSVPTPYRPPTSAPTPRSALRTPGASDTPRTQKRVLIALPTDSPPSTPSPAYGDHIGPGQYSASPNFQLGQQPNNSQGKTTNNRNRKKKHKRKSIESTEEEEDEEVPPPSRSPRFSVSSPVTSTSASSTFVLGPVPTPSEAHTHAPPTSLRPTTTSTTPAAASDKEITSVSAATPAAPPTIAKVQQYKPSRPSPLSQTAASPSATPAAADERPKKKGRVSDAAPVVKAVAKPSDNLPLLVGGLPPVVGAVEPAPAPVAIPVPGASVAAQSAPAAIPVPGAPAAKKKKKGQEVAAKDQEPKSAEPAEVPVPKAKKVRSRRSAGRKSLDSELNTEAAPQQPQPQAEAAPSAPTAQTKATASTTAAKAAPPATPLTRQQIIASIVADINASLAAKNSPAPLAPTPAADPSKTPAPQTPAPEHATPTPKSKLKSKDKPVKEMVAKGTKPESTTQRMLKELHKKRATTEPELPWDPREPFAAAPEPTSETPQPSSAAPEPSPDGPAHPTAATEPDSLEQTTPAAKKRSRKSDATTPVANGKQNGTPGSAKSATATPKSAAAAPSTPCVICGELNSHLQKDCPAVAAGVEKLKERLEVRRADLVQLRKEGKNRRQSDMKGLDEASDYGCQAIKSWIQRLTNIAAKVNGTESPAKSMAATPQSPATVAVKTPVPVTPATAEEPIVIDDDEEEDEEDEEDEDKEADGTSSAASSRASSPNSSAASTPVVVAPETPFYPATIHLKALARPRRPGSMSGLSVSDAVIETGDSGSESEESGSENENESLSGASSDNSSSDDEDVDPAELMRRVMNKPLSSRQRQRARLSAASMHHVEEASASDIESDEELPQHALQRRGSDSSIGDFEDETTKAAHSDAESESEGEDTKDAKAALLNSVADATMVVEEASDVEVEEVEVEEAEQSDVEELPQPSQPAEVVEPVDDLEPIVTDQPADEAADEAMDVDETVPEPEVEATPKKVAAADHSSPATERRASRGFNNLIPNSPVLEEFPGDIALREAIEEDAPINRDTTPTPEPESDDLHATQVDVMQLESLQPSQVEQPQAETEEEQEPEPEPVKPAPKRRGRPPKNPPSSPLKVPASQPTPSRSLRAASREPAPLPASQPETRSGRVTRSRGTLASSVAQPPAPPATRRRTRAASKEPPATPATTRRTRAASVEAAAAAAEAEVPASQPPTQPIIEESEDEFHNAKETPRANNNLSSPVLRNTRNVRSAVASSQVDELDSSYPVKTQLSPFTQKSPLPPSSMPNGHAHDIEVHDSATQSSPLLHRRRPVEETPLFMSEGSQALATQAYNAFPAPLVPETQIPETQDLQSSVAGSSVTGSSARGGKGKRTNGKSNGGGLAPTIDDDDDEATATSIVNGGGTYASDSDDDTATTTSRMFPPIPLSLPRRSTAAPLSSSFPTLSALPKDLLRSGKSVGTSVWNAVTGSGSRTTGVLPSQQRDDEDSEEESGSGTDSEDEVVPESRKGRYAGGARRKSRLSKTGGAMSGW